MIGSAGAWLGLGLVLAASPAQQAEERAVPEVFKMVDAYLVSNMQESLALSDEQFARLIPLVKALQRVRREHAQDRRQTLAQLRRELRPQSTPEASRVASLLDRLRAVERDGPQALASGYARIDAELDPIQQGRFRVMEVEVERRIRELLQRARSRDSRR